jgi:hypothetical protein
LTATPDAPKAISQKQADSPPWLVSVAAKR